MASLSTMYEGGRSGRVRTGCVAYINVPYCTREHTGIQCNHLIFPNGRAAPRNIEESLSTHKKENTRI